MPAQFSLCLYFSDFASDSVTGIGLLGTSSGTQWVILLYWVPPDRVLLRFCVTESVAELFPYGEISPHSERAHSHNSWSPRTIENKSSPVRSGFGRTPAL